MVDPLTVKIDDQGADGVSRLNLSRIEMLSHEDSLSTATISRKRAYQRTCQRHRTL